MSKKVGVLFFHPFRGRSRVGLSLFNAIQNLPSVTVRDVYEEIPDFSIHVEREQRFITEHDVVLFQHPMYWYSCPSLMKEWIDAVLEQGWAYGPGGDALKGKIWAQAITTGASAHAYKQGGFNRFSIAEFLRPFERTAELCLMTPIEPFVMHRAIECDERETALAAEAYRAWVIKLTRGEAPPLLNSDDRAHAAVRSLDYLRNSPDPLRN